MWISRTHYDSLLKRINDLEEKNDKLIDRVLQSRGAYPVTEEKPVVVVQGEKTIQPEASLYERQLGDSYIDEILEHRHGVTRQYATPWQIADAEMVFQAYKEKRYDPETDAIMTEIAH